MISDVTNRLFPNEQARLHKEQKQRRIEAEMYPHLYESSPARPVSACAEYVNTMLKNSSERRSRSIEQARQTMYANVGVEYQGKQPVPTADVVRRVYDTPMNQRKRREAERLEAEAKVIAAKVKAHQDVAAATLLLQSKLSAKHENLKSTKTSAIAKLHMDGNTKGLAAFQRFEARLEQLKDKEAHFRPAVKVRYTTDAPNLIGGEVVAFEEAAKRGGGGRSASPNPTQAAHQSDQRIAVLSRPRTISPRLKPKPHDEDFKLQTRNSKFK
jgi:hypothetical protein